MDALIALVLVVGYFVFMSGHPYGKCSYCGRKYNKYSGVCQAHGIR